MANIISFKVDKPNVPSGVVLIEDVAPLAKGLQDSILRLIQISLGYPSGKKVRGETKNLAPIGLINVKEGSGVLDFSPLPIDSFDGRLPAIIAASEIVNGVKVYQETGKWPNYMSSYVRGQLGSAIEPVIEGTSTVNLSVSENGMKNDVTIDKPLSRAMKELETVSDNTPIEIVGKIYDINVESKTFKVDTSIRKVIIETDEEYFKKADSLRWKRVYLVGVPKDEKCIRIGDIQELRAAKEDEEDGISNQCDFSPIESLPEYQQVIEKIEEFSKFEKNWNSYGANAPNEQTVRFSRSFLKDTFSVLKQHDITIPNTFVVPTVDGGTQFEWELEDRALELEIIANNTFKYLKVQGEIEIEGDATRWQALRLIRWVLTGENI